MNGSTEMPGAPTPPLLEGDGTPPPEATSAPPAARYCSGCGAAWQAGWTECPRCARGRPERTPARRTEGAEERPLLRALSLYFALLSTSLVGGVIAARVSGAAEGPDELFIQWTVEAVDAFLVLVWCFVARKDLAPVLRAGCDLRWYGLAAAGSVATFVTASLAVELITGMTGAEELKLAEPVFEAGHGWPTVLLTICLQPAIVEELAFRGVILAALGRILRPAEAVVVSSMMFMVLHLSVMSFPHLLLMGLALGLLRVRSGSLYPGMVLHYLHNLYCVVAEALPGA